MKKRLIKALSVILTVMMLVGVVPVGAMTAFAADVKEAAPEVRERVTFTAKKAGNAIKGAAKSAVNTVANGIKFATNAVADGAESVYNSAANAVSTGVDAIQTVIETRTSGDYEYIVLDDGTAEITKYIGNDTEVVIPSEIDGYKVTKIGAHTDLNSNGAFENNNIIENVTIPKGVTGIGERAFNDCDYLNKVTMFYGVIDIGEMAFNGCIRLTSVLIPDSVIAIDNYAFRYCRELHDVSLGNSVEKLGWHVFDDTAIEELIIPKSLTETSDALERAKQLKRITFAEGTEVIPSNVLKRCASVCEVVIPDGVTTIGASAFAECENLVDPKIPESITSIGNNAFAGCKSITKPIFYKGITRIEYSTYSGCVGITEAIIPEGVTFIGVGAFADCTALEYVRFPEGLKTIDDGAFRGCSSLVSLDIPNGINDIGIKSFKDCTNLTNVTIADSVTEIWNNAFENCTSLVSVKLGEGLKRFGCNAFKNTGITEIIVPKNVSEIITIYGETSPFDGANNLTKVTFQEGMIKIPKYMLRNCVSVVEIEMPNSIETIEGYALAGTSITEIEVPTSLTSFSGWYYQGHDKLKKAVFREGATYIPSSMFENCVNLEEVVIPDSITEIGGYAFYGCSSLKSVSLGSGVQIIGGNAFSETSITEILIPKSVKKMSSSGSSGSPFGGENSRLKKVVLEEGMLIIPNSAFGYCPKLEEVFIPNSVTEIGSHAFNNCIALNNVIVPDGVVTIGTYAFYGCTNLDSITFGSRLQKIGSRSFNKTAIEEIVIPKNVSAMQGAFVGAEKLKIVEFEYGMTAIPNFALEKCISIEKIVIPDSVTTIGIAAFKECVGLTDITIPKNIREIQEKVFDGCTNLKRISFDEGMKNIPDRTLENCTSVELVYLPASLSKIGKNAFNGCDGLTDVYYNESVFLWLGVEIADGNEPLKSAQMHYKDQLPPIVSDDDESLETDDIYESAVNIIAYDKEKLEEGAYISRDDLKLEGVKVVAGDYENVFDKKLNISSKYSGETAVFSKDGFYDYIVPAYIMDYFFDGYIEKTMNIYMKKDRKDGKPYVSTVFACEENRDSNFVELQNQKLKALLDDKYDINVSAVSGEEIVEYVLSQDDAHKISSDNGYFSSVNICSTFKTGKDIYVYVKTKSGAASTPVKLKIDVEGIKLPDSNKISLLGKDMFKIKFDDNLPLVGGAEISMNGFEFPIGIEIDGDKFKISFGLNIFEAKRGDEDDTHVIGDKKRWEKFKKDVTFINKLDDQSEKIEHYKKFYETFAPGETYETKGTNFNTSCLGYAEGTIVNGKLVPTEISGGITAEFFFNYTQQGVAWVVPYYTSVKAGADGSFMFKGLRYLPDKSVPFDLGVLLDITPQLKLGGGIGVKDVISGGVYGKGSLPFQNDFAKQHTLIKLSGEVGVEAELLWFKGNKSILSGSTVLYDNYYGSSKTMVKAPNMFVDHSIKSRKEIDETQMETTVIPRDYQKKTSAWKGGSSSKRPAAPAAAVSGLEIRELQTSIFKNTQAQLVTLNDGRMIAAWISDAAKYNDYNRLQLVYSVYNNGAWSEPKAVADDGTNDGYPALATDGKNVFVAWQNIKRVINEDESTSINAALENSEICISKYNSAKDCFEGTKTLTSNSSYDFNPVLAVNNGNAVLYWLYNSKNNLTVAGSNTVYRYSTADGTIKPVIMNANHILDMDCAFVNGKDQISFSTDTDGNLSTTNDIKVYTFADGKRVLQSPSNEEIETADTSVAYGKLDGNTTLFFGDANDIYYVQNGEVKKVFTEARQLAGNLQVVNSGNVTSLVWTEGTDKGNDIWMCTYNGGKWSKPVQLSDTGALLNDINVVYNNGKIKGIFSRTAREKQDDGSYKNGQTDLCFMQLTEFSDAEASFGHVSEADFVKGEKAKIPVYLKNVGTKQIESVKVTLTDSFGTNFATTQNVALPSGEEKYIDIEYTVPQSFAKGSLNLNVTVVGDSEFNTANNKDSIDVGFVDISIGSITVEDLDKYYVLTATLSNDNLITANGVKINVRRNSADGEILKTVSAGNMAPGGLNSIQYIVSKDSLVYDEENLSKIYFEATIQNPDDELIKKDNISGVVLDERKPCETHTYGDWKVIKEPTCTEDGSREHTCTVCGEKVSEVMAAKGHKYVESITKKPTCTANGTKKFTCFCGNSYTEIIPATGHSVGDWEIVKEPTEAETGLKQRKCTVCGKVIEEAVIPALGKLVDSGYCGMTTKWKFYTNGVLVISGTGIVKNYDKASLVPWSKYASQIKSVVVKDGITRIGEFAFYGCANLTSVTLPSSLKEINGYVFKNCANLKEITLPKNLEKIGDSAFYGTGLTKLSIPANINYIGWYAFSRCYSLKNVEFMGNAPEFAGKTFNMMTATVNYPVGNATWTTAKKQQYGGTIKWLEAGLIDEGLCGSTTSWKLSADGTLTISGTGIVKNYSSPSLVPWNKYASQIKKVVVEEGVTRIGEFAFYGCKNLTSVTLPNSLKEINGYVFKNCSSLTEITLPSGLTKIGDSAFYGTGLKKLTIPATVKYVGWYAFSRCASLTEIEFLGSAPELPGKAFNMVTATVYYPSGNSSWNNVAWDILGGTITHKAK